MGADIHCILQEKVEDEWVTRAYDVFGGRNYTFFRWLSGVRGSNGRPVRTEGFPSDFEFITEMTNENGSLYTTHLHNGFDMGDHNFGHVTLDKFLKARILKPDKEDIEPYKIAVRYLLGDWHMEKYRIVFGYDS